MVRTKKTGIIARYGARYGSGLKDKAKETDIKLKKKYPCPRCNMIAVRRTSSGIWNCKHCGLVFAGGAYSPEIFRPTTVKGEQKNV